MDKVYRVLIILFISIICSSCSNGQTKADQIQLIRAEFRNINSDNSLRKISLQNEEFLTNMTDGGGELHGFYEGSKIRKIHQWVGISYGNDSKEFYFKDDELIFVYEVFNTFLYDSAKQEFDYTKTKLTFEGRFYFNHRKLIERVEKGHSENGWVDLKSSLLREADENLKLLRDKLKHATIR